MSGQLGDNEVDSSPSGEKSVRENQVPYPLYTDDDSSSAESVKLDLNDTSAIAPPEDPVYEESLTEEKKPCHRTMFEWIRDHIGYFRPYFILDFLDYKSLRIIAKSWIKAWVCLLLMVIPKTGEWLGSSSYQLVIYSFVMPSGSFSIAQSVMYGLIVVVGAIFGWIHAIVASGIASAINGNRTEEDFMEELIERGVCQVGPELQDCFERKIFEGYFITAKTSAVYIIAIVFAVTFFSFVRMKYRPLTFGGVIGNIAVLISLIEGSYFPYFETSFGESIVKSVGITFAINLAVSIILFPKTSNYAYFNFGMNQLKGLYSVSRTVLSVVRRDRPSHSKFTRFRRIGRMVAMLRARSQVMDGDLAAMGIEISYGRFDRYMASRFIHLLHFVGGQLDGFDIFFQYLADCRNVVIEKPIEDPDNPDDRPFKNKAGLYEHEQRQLYYDVAKRKVTVEDMDSVLDVIATQLEQPLAVGAESMEVIYKWLDAANHFRVYSIFNRKKYVAKQQEMAAMAKEMRTKLQEVMAIIDSSEWREDFKNEFNREHFVPALVGQAFLFGFLVRQFLYSLEVVLDHFIIVDEECPLPRIITPFTKAINISVPKSNFKSSPHGHSGGSGRDPEADPPKNMLQKFGRFISHLYRKAHDKELVIAFRTGLFSALAAFPAFFRTTAGWYFGNKLVWVSVYCSLATDEHLGDSIYGFICESIYTFLSCVFGLVSWYIGAGHGPGNYYGIAAITGVVFIPLLFYRHFSIHFTPAPGVVLCVTYVLVIGTSWQDGHYPEVLNPGYGWHPTWLKFVSVITGLTLGMMASIFPKPYTSKKEVRRSLARLLKESGRVMCDVATFAIERSRDASTKIRADGHDKILNHLTEQQATLAYARTRLKAVKYEPPLQGTFPRQKYARLLKIQSEILLGLRYLYHMLNQIEDPQKVMPVLVRRFGWTNNSLCSDLLAVIHMSSSSLFTKSPLPMLTPAQTTFKHYLVREMENFILRTTGDHDKFAPGESLTREHFHLDHYDMTRDGRLSIAAQCLVADIYQKLDDIAILIKELVGEEYEIDRYYLENDLVIKTLV
ncbi:hypothetical protein TRVA0_005S00980 [Trichomonascus vanleenenianus]|uniref:uncharacterized protein n=1 Tax=Trichomonascus vanleenenianus TaxID=2268995 RepID=UPI003ECA0804